MLVPCDTPPARGRGGDARAVTSVCSGEWRRIARVEARSADRLQVVASLFHRASPWSLIIVIPVRAGFADRRSLFPTRLRVLYCRECSRRLPEAAFPIVPLSLPSRAAVRAASGGRGDARDREAPRATSLLLLPAARRSPS